MNRPDLSGIPQEIEEYINYLESQLAKFTQRPSKISPTAEPAISDAPLLDEPPTRVNLITLSKNGLGKRTLRHLYSRQHRGGMGVFDLETSPKEDYPLLLASAEEEKSLLLFTNFGRAFRLPVNRFEKTDIRSKGTNVLDKLVFEEGEIPAALLPEQASGYVCMVTKSGRIRCLRHHLFGEHMRPGTAFFSPSQTGELISACWTSGDADVFILTKFGMGIRFPEKLISPQGDWAIRLAPGDQVVSVSGVFEDSRVLLTTGDGKGTLRTMSGFAANKSLGGGGKIAMKTEQALAGLSVKPAGDFFIISRLGKLIRFQVDEIPETESPVQGVLCMQLRADEAMAVIQS